jgi:predicted ATPase with chaperone activity
MLGPPEAGKLMLARRLTTLPPAMTLPEAIETACIHSVSGLTGERTAFVTTRPCRSPHHTISDVGLIGEGERGRATYRWCLVRELSVLGVDGENAYACLVSAGSAAPTVYE